MRALLSSAALALAIMAATAAEPYKHGPDSERQPGVPQGKVSKFTHTSKVFPDTVRDGWTYVPAQADPGKPLPFMVFQDGGSYMNEKGDFRVPVVLDNLIHKKEVPVMAAIFLNPGSVPATQPER